jgi:DNA-binding transcriptional regulator YbjK
MYQDDSLSAIDKRRMLAFVSDKRRMERLQRNLMLRHVIDQEKERIKHLRSAMEEKKRKEIEDRINAAAAKI